MERQFTKWIKGLCNNFILGIRLTFSRISLWKFFTEFIIIIFFNILPTIVTILWVKLTTGNVVSYYELYKGGEFLLYSVSFFSSALVAMTNRQFSRNDWREQVKNLLIIPILLTSIVYTSVFVSKGNVNKESLEGWSYFCAIISLSVFFFAQFWSSMQPVDVVQERKNEQSNIMDSLN